MATTAVCGVGEGDDFFHVGVPPPFVYHFGRFFMVIAYPHLFVKCNTVKKFRFFQKSRAARRAPGRKMRKSVKAFLIFEKHMV